MVMFELLMEAVRGGGKMHEVALIQINLHAY